MEGILKGDLAVPVLSSRMLMGVRSFECVVINLSALLTGDLLEVSIERLQASHNISSIGLCKAIRHIWARLRAAIPSRARLFALSDRPE